MQSLSRSALILLHFCGYGLVFICLQGPLRWESILFVILLIWISVIDTERFEIPDKASAILAISGLLTLFGVSQTELIDHLLGGVLWPFLFWAVAHGYLRARGFHGLGLGDVKLMCGIGLWCGFLATIHVVLAASLAAIILLGLNAITPKADHQPISQSKVAFGPFLCLSAWTIWLAGAPL